MVNNNVGTNAGSGGHYCTHWINLSSANPIYGNSTTVQPQSIKVLYYIVIASSITNELNLDVADMATKSLDNLDNTGKNIANWSNNVTNCITEIPQDIKLELNNSTITLKAGSKVYVPNGTGVFDEVIIASDLTATYPDTSDVKCFLFYVNGTLILGNIVVSFSGTTPPTTGFFYNTSTNKISFYLDGNMVWDNGSFPLCIASCSNNSITSIDQVFNGFGYIGSTVFALPNVKGLIPNGRNADGTLKNIEFTLDKVLIYTYSVNLNNAYVSIVADSGKPTGLNYRSINGTQTSGWYHDEEKNIYTYNGSVRLWVDYGTISTNSNGVITSLTPKTAFHAVDYNDSSTISGWSMPSSRYIDLTLGASGATYTAPANGYISMVMGGTVSGNMGYFSQLYDNGVEIRRFGDQSTSGAYHVFTLNFEIGKGQAFNLSYYGTTPNFFRFIYAEGEN
jgi:hypothetical protein